MTDLLVRGGLDRALVERPPAFPVTRACLRVQSTARQPGPLGRMFGRNPLSPDARSWYRGALGEIEVATVLRRLGAQWTVLHGFEVGDRDAHIDHLLIGPAGILSITEKDHSGHRVVVGGKRLTVNGRRTEHLAIARADADRASDFLSSASGSRVSVTPLVVVLNPSSLDTRKADSAVTVLASSSLREWLAAHRVVFTDKEVARLSEVVRARALSSRAAEFGGDPRPYLEEFERLRHEVESADRRADRWLGVLVALPALSILFGLLAAAL